MSAIVELARPGNAAMASFSALLGMLVVMGPDLAEADMVIPLVLGMLVPFFVTAGGNALNDHMDYLVDLEAHPERPLPSGRLALGQVYWFAMGWFFIGLALAAVIVTLTEIGLLPVPSSYATRWPSSTMASPGIWLSPYFPPSPSSSEPLWWQSQTTRLGPPS
jgi:geranylgeranylglycerol-phosphate geranylgeranyltransferase